MFIVKWWVKIINTHSIYLWWFITLYIIKFSLSLVPLSSNIVSSYKKMTNKKKHQKWIKWSSCLFVFKVLVCLFLIFIYSIGSNCLIVPKYNHTETCKTVTIVLQHLHKNNKFNIHFCFVSWFKISVIQISVERDAPFNFKEVLCPPTARFFFSHKTKITVWLVENMNSDVIQYEVPLPWLQVSSRKQNDTTNA